MAQQFVLSEGAAEAMFNNVEVKQPILQILNCRSVVGGNVARYRVVLSDGRHYIQGMLATQVNKLVETAQIGDMSIVRVNETLTNTVHGKKIAIILALDVLATSAAPIGDPQPLDAGAAAGAVQPPMQQQQQQQVLTTPVAPPPTSTGAPPTAAYMSSAAAHFAAPPTSSAASTMAYGGGGGGGGSLAGSAVFPISSLSPYVNKWTIKVRVTKKGDVKMYNNAKGGGKLMSVDLLDAQGGEIRATMFNEQVDSFNGQLEKNQVYLISGGTLKQANKKYTTLNCEYELTFNSQTVIEPCRDNAVEIKMQQYAFVPISDITHKQKDDIIDVLGVVTNIGALASINTSKGQPLAKRTVGLLDTSARSIELTLWGATAENFSVAGSPVLACKAVRVSDYAGRTLGTMSNSDIAINPAGVPEVQQLRQWVDAQGGVANIQSYSLTQAGGSGGGFGGGGGGGGASGPADFKTFDEVQRANLGAHAVAVFDCEAIITMLNREGTWMYNSCPKDDCKKKVTQDHVGGWRCEKCSMTYPECNPRYIISMTASDATGKLWISLFNDEATKVLGMPAKDLLLLQQQDPKAFENVFENALYQTVSIRIKAKSETYNESERVKFSAMSLNFLSKEKGGEGWGNSIARLTKQLASM